MCGYRTIRQQDADRRDDPDNDIDERIKRIRQWATNQPHKQCQVKDDDAKNESAIDAPSKRHRVSANLLQVNVIHEDRQDTNAKFIQIVACDIASRARCEQNVHRAS